MIRGTAEFNAAKEEAAIQTLVRAYLAGESPLIVAPTQAEAEALYEKVKARLVKLGVVMAPESSEEEGK